MNRAAADWPLRPVTRADLPALAELWFRGWHEAIADLVPHELVAARTKSGFARRLDEMAPTLIAAGPEGAPLGFCAVKEDEIYQIFVAPEARGSGLAARLLAEGEARIAAAGHDAAWLHCSIGNDHAARFYERAGWYLAETEHAAFGDGDAWVSLDILVYRKRLKQPAG